MTQILADFSMVLRLVSSKIYRKLAKRMQRAQSFHKLLSFNIICHPRKSASSVLSAFYFGPIRSQDFKALKFYLS